MLTSFGITEPHQKAIENQKAPSLFYRMPPVSMRGLTNTFMPDYATLLLYEKLLMDETSFYILKENSDPLYSDMADTIVLLHSEGFVELVDFSSILQQNDFLFQKMIENDLKFIDQWVEPLKDSLVIWLEFTEKARDLALKSQKWETLYPPTRGAAYFEPNENAQAANLSRIMHIVNNTAGLTYSLAREALDSSRKRRKPEYRDAFREALQSYLSYVNANLLISNELNVGFHDWADIQPFYQQKFLYVGQEDRKTLKQEETSRKLFEISFPEFTIDDPVTFLKVVQDRRIEDLRQLVTESVDGNVTFDNDFAKNVLKEVLYTERRISRYRNIVSYLTIPIGFIPWVGTAVQKVIEDGIGFAIKHKLQKKHQWFYLFSEVVEKPEP